MLSMLVAALALVSAEPAAAGSRSVAYRTLPIDVDARPSIVQAVQGDDGRSYIVYDLLIANWSAAELPARRRARERWSGSCRCRMP